MGERAIAPRARGVTLFAAGRKVVGDVVWVARRLVGIQVAGRACGAEAAEHAPRVAGRAGAAGVTVRQGEGRCVLEVAAAPTARVVARGTVGREVVRRVGRIPGRDVIVGVARRAGRAEAGVDARKVALGAGAVAMAERQRERLRVRELRRDPADWPVAALTVRSEAGGDMVVRRPRELTRMAAVAVRTRTGEVANLCTWMTTKARRRRMRTDQRQPRAIVLGDHFTRPPRPLIMAVGAVATELPAMRIGVTTGATLGRELRDRTAVVVAQ